MGSSQASSFTYQKLPVMRMTTSLPSVVVRHIYTFLIKDVQDANAHWFFTNVIFTCKYWLQVYLKIAYTRPLCILKRNLETNCKECIVHKDVVFYCQHAPQVNGLFEGRRSYMHFNSRMKVKYFVQLYGSYHRFPTSLCGNIITCCDGKGIMYHDEI